MSNSIGVLVLGVLLTGMLLLFHANAASDEIVRASIQQAAQLESERARTALSIEFAEAHSVFRCDTRVELAVKNTGRVSIGDFDHMDVFTWYTPQTGDPVMRRFGYSAGNLAKDEWTLASITPDNGNLRWEPGETAVLSWRFLQPQKQGTPGYISVGTPNAVADGVYVEFSEVATGNCLFLHNFPTPPTGNTASQPVLPVDSELPSAVPKQTLFNYDTDRDGDLGLKLVRSQKGLGETLPSRFQEWRTGPLTSPIVIAEDVLVDIWAALTPANTGATGIVVVYLRDYNGVTYTEIGEGAVFARDWQSGSSTFVEKLALITGLDYTVPAGHELEIRFIVDIASSQDMAFAYDTEDFPAMVNLSFTAPPPSSSLHLHNYPTPPIGDTSRQAELPLDTTAPTSATLYQYAFPDNNPGLLLKGTTEGLNEPDSSKYQVWKTGPLASDMPIVGDVFMDLWAGIRQFQASQSGALTVYLRDYDGASYVEIANGSIFAEDWQAGSDTFVNRTIMIADIDYTIPAGHKLEIRLQADAIKSSKDMWIAYDTMAYPTVIKFP